ncbi:aspartate aminotransferase, putative [Eimeria mitis]|uniref:Aspartate aminotransferase, putative n=1 Tax=Eimeria mitis TaxID=44415 RepID=U6K2D8_9EIME|nr:aspartate aminotransferase, putative [Eimeria mitis]CDJ29933.1 aspartate aminotransferase, putative [Eimeria mitis]
MMPQGVVREAEAELLKDETLDKEYLPIDGLPELKPLTQSLLFGEDSEAIAAGRIASSQSLSGTGALRVVGDFIKHFIPQAKTVYLSNPTWSNHHNIFGPGAGLTIAEYPYWDPTVYLSNPTWSNHHNIFESLLAIAFRLRGDWIQHR